MTGDTEHVETSKEKRVGSLFRSHGQKELRPYSATASGREGLRRVALTPCCLVIQTKKLADSNRAKNAQSIGLTFGFSSRPRSGISCAAEE